jgi:hypothetical protein
MFHKNNYKKLANFLKSHGYVVTETVEEEISYPSLKIYHASFKCWRVSGKGITAMFCTPNTSSYRYVNGRFAAENERCFDKWSKAPLVMNMSGIDHEKLLKELELLGSEEGYEISNGFTGGVFTYEVENGLWY